MAARRARRRPARDRGRVVRAAAAAAATGRHRGTGRLRAHAAGPRRLGAGAEPEGRAAGDRERRALDAAAAVGEPCPQPGQPAQGARRRGGRDRGDPRRARCGRLEVPARSRHQHRVRLHDPGPRRARRGAAPAARGARYGGRSRGAGRHRRLRRPEGGARAVRAQLRDRRRPARLRALPRHARARHGQRLRGLAGRRPALRRVPGRHRRLPARAGRERQRRHRGRRLAVREHGRADRARHRRAARAAREGRAVARRRDPARHAVARRLAEDAARTGPRDMRADPDAMRLCRSPV